MFAEAEADPSLSKEDFKPLEARLRVALLNAQYQRCLLYTSDAADE